MNINAYLMLAHACACVQYVICHVNWQCLKMLKARLRSQQYSPWWQQPWILRLSVLRFRGCFFSASTAAEAFLHIHQRMPLDSCDTPSNCMTLTWLYDSRTSRSHYMILYNIVYMIYIDILYPHLPAFIFETIIYDNLGWSHVWH